MKHYEKFIFLFVIMAVVFFARLMYPGISALPTLAAADAPVPASVRHNDPPLLALSAGSVTETGGSAAANGSIVNGSADPGAPAAGSVFTRIATIPVPTVNARSYLVADLATGAILAGSNIDARWPTASLTKLMTATLVFDQLATSTKITITPSMFSVDPGEYTLAIGGTYTVNGLLHLMLMPSSNVAAEAMADTIGHAQFINELNARAAAWGMTNSYFEDTSGISAANQSTARDLLSLAQHIYQYYPGILALTDTPATTIENYATGQRIPVHSINSFAGQSDFIGGKTGNTPQAGANLLSIFRFHGNPVIIVVLGEDTLPSTFTDTARLYSWFKQDFQ